jgi:hypothetical protein
MKIIIHTLLGTAIKYDLLITLHTINIKIVLYHILFISGIVFIITLHYRRQFIMILECCVITKFYEILLGAILLLWSLKMHMGHMLHYSITI